MIRRVSLFQRFFLVLFIAAVLSPAGLLAAETLQLLKSVEVNSQGIFLDQVATCSKRELLSNILLAPAPPFGESIRWSREDFTNFLTKAAPKLANSPLSGAELILITRQSRKLEEKEVLKLLTERLLPERKADEIGKDKDRGDILELRFTRKWDPILVPTEPIELRIVEQPASGLAASLMVRFEIRSNEESVGTFSAFLQARLYRQVWIARSVVRRGTRLDAADLAQEKRDVVNNMKEPVWTGQFLDPSLQIAENIPAGGTVYARMVKPRPVMQRGQYVQAVATSKFMTVSTRVEILEDGAVGQIIRARNLTTKKEVRGKVINEDTIEIEF